MSARVKFFSIGGYGKYPTTVDDFEVGPPECQAVGSISVETVIKPQDPMHERLSGKIVCGDRSISYAEPYYLGEMNGTIVLSDVLPNMIGQQVCGLCVGCSNKITPNPLSYNK